MVVVFRAPAAALFLSIGALPALAQTKSEVSIIRQRSIIYLPAHITEKQRLIEKHPAELGSPGLKVKWAAVQPSFFLEASVVVP